MVTENLSVHLTNRDVMCLQGREKVSIKVLAADVCDFILESVSLTFLLACDTN